MKDPRLVNAGLVARSLIESLPSPTDWHHFDDLPVEEGSFSPIVLDEPPAIAQIRRKAALRLKELEQCLDAANWTPEAEMPLFPVDERWTLGSVEHEAPLRKIHLGYLHPIKHFPILERVPDRAIAFLTKISGWSDYVKRENHPGVGIHYHYLSAAKKRSDVLLAWDTRWQSSPGSDPLRPLFGEKHAEGRADFAARPWAWGDQKKASMYAACEVDLARWPIGEFRCASQSADAVWPSGTVVTPLPAISSPVLSSRRKSRRR